MKTCLGLKKTTSLRCKYVPITIRTLVVIRDWEHNSPHLLFFTRTSGTLMFSSISCSRQLRSHFTCSRHIYLHKNPVFLLLFWEIHSDSNFHCCSFLMMFFQTLSLGLCTRSETPFPPPRTTQILDEVAQQGRLGESSPKRVQWRKMERKPFELYFPRMRQHARSCATGDMSDNSHNISFTNVLFTCLKKAPNAWSMSAYPKWLTPGFESRMWLVSVSPKIYRWWLETTSTWKRHWFHCGTCTRGCFFSSTVL